MASAGAPLKKPRREAEERDGDGDAMETGNVASLVSIFGSSFSGLLSRKSPCGGNGEEASAASAASGVAVVGAPRDAEPGQVCCDGPALRSLSPWSTAIVAF